MFFVIKASYLAIQSLQEDMPPSSRTFMVASRISNVNNEAVLRALLTVAVPPKGSTGYPLRTCFKGIR